MHKCSLKENFTNEIYDKNLQGHCKKLKRNWLNLVTVSITHPLCGKHFISETSVMNEKKRQIESHWPYIIHPMSKFRIWYEVYLMILYTTALFMNPIESAFSKIFKWEFMKSYYPVQTTVDILCIIDVIFNFFTGFVKNRRDIELRPKQICKNYIIGYFFLDVLSAIPRDLLYMLFPPPYPPLVLLGILNICRYIKFPRIVTLTQIIQRVSSFYNKKTHSLLHYFRTILVVILIVHYFACLQYGLSRIVNRFFSYTKKSRWMYNYGIFEQIAFYKYIHSFFRSSSYLLGIRMYNMYMIRNISDYILSMVTIIFGKCLLAVLWVVLAVTIINARKMTIKFQEVINQLNEYMKQKQLPQDLRTKILKYYHFKYKRRYLKDVMITAMLSEHIKNEINICMYKNFISNVALFADLKPEQIFAIVSKLVSEIFLPNEIIIQSGTEGNCMYFIESGTVAVYTHSGKEVAHLEDGAYFGEISLIVKGKMRIATIMAVECSKLYRLNRRDFNKILITNTEVYKKIMATTEKRMKQITKAEETFKKALFAKTYTKESRI